jgi:hypothetical protein
MLTFADWEHYTDDAGNARTLDWSPEAMRGASPYPYLVAIAEAARLRYEIPQQSPYYDPAEPGQRLAALHGHVDLKEIRTIVERLGYLVYFNLNWTWMVDPTVPLVAGATIAEADMPASIGRNDALGDDAEFMYSNSNYFSVRGLRARVLRGYRKILENFRRRRTNRYSQTAAPQPMPPDGYNGYYPHRIRQGYGTTYAEAVASYLNGDFFIDGRSWSARTGFDRYAQYQAPSLFGNPEPVYQIRSEEVEAKWDISLPYPARIIHCLECRSPSLYGNEAYENPDYQTPDGDPPHWHVESVSEPTTRLQTEKTYGRLDLPALTEPPAIGGGSARGYVSGTPQWYFD